MTKITGLGGITEKLPTGRNVAEQKLWVAVHIFDEAANLKGVAWVPWFLELEEKIGKIMKEIANLQWELWGLENKRDVIIELLRKMAEAFLEFINGALRIGRWSLSIIKLVDPNFPDDLSKADIAWKLADPLFQDNLYNFANTITDLSFTALETAVQESSSMDFSKTFGKFRNLRNAFVRVSGDLPKIEWDIETKNWEIRTKEGEKAWIEGSYNELKPLYNEMKKLERSANLRTGASRLLWATGGAAAIALSSWYIAPHSVSQPQLTGATNTINQSSNVLPWHQVWLNGNIIQVSPNATQTGNAYVGGSWTYQLNVSGNISQWASGTLKYKLWTNIPVNLPIKLINGINQVQLVWGPQITISIVTSWNSVSLTIQD